MSQLADLCITINAISTINIFVGNKKSHNWQFCLACHFLQVYATAAAIIFFRILHSLLKISTATKI